MDITPSDLDAEVQRRADELTPELLPHLLRRLMARDSLVFCERHDRHLFSYIRAQVNLTRTKRRHYDDYSRVCEKNLEQAEKVRNEIRVTYRSTPCTCWVRHR
jgi:hypothetical protein